MVDDMRIRLYCDERTGLAKMVESLLNKHEIRYSAIPCWGITPYLLGPGVMSFNFSCPTDRDEDFERHILHMKDYLLKNQK